VKDRVKEMKFGVIKNQILNYHHHNDHVSFMELGHLLTRCGLTCPEASAKVCHDSFCQSGSSVSLPWVVYYGAFCLHVVPSFSCIPVICPKLELLGRSVASRCLISNS
jgi:hypothetical protein